MKPIFVFYFVILKLFVIVESEEISLFCPIGWSLENLIQLNSVSGSEQQFILCSVCYHTTEQPEKILSCLETRNIIEKIWTLQPLCHEEPNDNETEFCQLVNDFKTSVGITFTLDKTNSTSLENLRAVKNSVEDLRRRDKNAPLIQNQFESHANVPLVCPQGSAFSGIEKRKFLSPDNTNMVNTSGILCEWRNLALVSTFYFPVDLKFVNPIQSQQIKSYSYNVKECAVRCDSKIISIVDKCFVIDNVSHYEVCGLVSGELHSMLEHIPFENYVLCKDLSDPPKCSIDGYVITAITVLSATTLSFAFIIIVMALRNQRLASRISKFNAGGLKMKKKSRKPSAKREIMEPDSTSEMAYRYTSYEDPVN